MNSRTGRNWVAEKGERIRESGLKEKVCRYKDPVGAFPCCMWQGRAQAREALWAESGERWMSEYRRLGGEKGGFTMHREAT